MIRPSVCCLIVMSLSHLPATSAEQSVEPPSAAVAETLQRWQEAKFGLFVHWGLYSLAEGQWKGSRVSVAEGPWKGKGFTEFLQLQARIPVAGYEAFAKGFRPDAFDADAWVRTASDAGMRYVVFTTKHHEGFAMYRSPSSPFNIVDHSGFPRDPVAELAAACRRHGLMFGVYYSLGRDWHDPDAPTDWPTQGGRSNTWDYPDEDAKVFDRYFRRKVLPQVRELLTQYGPVDIFWFDTPERITAAQSRELRDLIRGLQPACLVNDRVGNQLGDFQTHEQKVPDGSIPLPWESCATLGKNWSYHPQDTNWKSPTQIVRLLTDVASKGGNLLFNIGPRANGAFPAGAAEHLVPVGAWLTTNRAAIYGAVPWKTFGEGANDSIADEATAPATADTVRDEISRSEKPDLRFTVGAERALYVIARNWTDPKVVSKSLGLANAPRIQAVSLLGSDAQINWRQTEHELEITFPANRPGDIPVWTFRLQIIVSNKPQP